MLQALMLLAAICNASHTEDFLSLFKHSSKLCASPDGFPFPYSGYRAYQAHLIDWPVRHFWYLARCSSGTIAEEQFFPTNRTTNFIFGEPLCISKDECYIISRRRKYAPRASPVYLPFVTVGALYKYDPFTEKAEPVALMKSDKASARVTVKLGLVKKIRFTPVLFSSGSHVGTASLEHLEISPSENYTYVEADKHQAWWKMNEFANKLVNQWDLGDNRTFWEFDALQQHLSDELAWRDKLNSAIS